VSERVAIPHLLSMEDLDEAAITAILDTAAGFRDIALRPIKKVPTLRGRTVCNLFYEDSTRTRTSFELAAKRLSADTLNFSVSGSSVSKGESLKDTALTLQAMGVDAIVIRHDQSGAAATLTRFVDAHVLNAGDGWHQHPTQALLDLFTVREHFGALSGLTVTVVGDVLHSRVARSVIQGFTAMGARVTVCAPPTLLPVDVGAWGCGVTTDLDALLPDTDVLYLLRVQRERMSQQFFPTTREYARLWGVDRDRLGELDDQAVVLHPGPMNRGVEIAADVADAPNALITEQVSNGIAVRMSCLYLMLGGEHAGQAGDARRAVAGTAGAPEAAEPPPSSLSPGASQ
jgi:aspartate carbamoyltransferase catalytic subunit